MPLDKSFISCRFRRTGEAMDGTEDDVEGLELSTVGWLNNE